MLSLVAALALAAQPAVGDTVPDFTVSDLDGAELKLSELAKKGNVVIAFFPKAFTPG